MAGILDDLYARMHGPSCSYPCGMGKAIWCALGSDLSIRRFLFRYIHRKRHSADLSTRNLVWYAHLTSPPEARSGAAGSGVSCHDTVWGIPHRFVAI